MLLDLCFDVVVRGEEEDDSLVDVLRRKDRIRLSDFVHFERWGESGHIATSLLLEPSNAPYFCIPVATSVLGRKRPSMQNFVLRLYAHGGENLEIERYLMLPPIEKSDRDQDCHSLPFKWSFHGDGDPHEGSTGWAYNDRVVMTVQRPVRALVVLQTQQKRPNGSYGFAIVRPPVGSDDLSPVLEENRIIADTVLVKDERIKKCYVLLEPSEPYYFVPFTKSKMVGRASFIYAPRDEIEARVVDAKPPPILDSWSFKSGWAEGVCSPDPDSIGFESNPRFVFDVSHETTMDYLVGSRHVGNVRLFRKSDDGLHFLPLNEFGSGQVQLSVGRHIFIPTMSREKVGGKFTFSLGTRAGTSVLRRMWHAVPSHEKLRAPRREAVGVWKRKHYSGYTVELDRLHHNPCVSIDKSTPGPFVLKVELMAEDRSFKTVHFYVVEEVRSGGSEVVHSPTFRPFQTRSSCRLFLDPGLYKIYIMCDCYPDAIDDNQCRYRIRVRGSQGFEFESPDTSAMGGSQRRPTPLPPVIDERFEMIANNVRRILSSRDVDRMFGAPLVVFGPHAWPIVAGLYTTKNMYSLSTDDKRRSVARMDKWGYSDTFVDSLVPFVAAGEIGKGCVVAIGDPFVFSNRNVHRADNRTFLLNCAEFVMRKAYDNLDVLDGLGSGMGRRKHSSEDLQLQLQSHSVMESPRGKRLTMLTHSLKPELVPASDLERTECRVQEVSVLSRDLRRCGESLSAFFLVFEENEMMPIEDANEIVAQIEKGVGAIILTKCHKHAPKGPMVYPGNYILSAAGIVVSRGEVVQNTAHVHSDLDWLGDLSKLPNGMVMPNHEISHESIYAVTHSRRTREDISRLRVDHVLSMNRRRGAENDPASRHRARETLHILEMACLSIPLDDSDMMPLLRSRFSHPFVSPRRVEPDSQRRLALALSTNLWLNRRNYATLEHYRLRFDIDSPPTTHHVPIDLLTPVQFLSAPEEGSLFCGTFSLGICARPGETVVVHVPPRLVGRKCTLSVGVDQSDLWWFRDCVLNRYPVQWIAVDVDSEEVHLSNVFGGPIMLRVPSRDVVEQHVIGSSEEEGENEEEDGRSTPVTAVRTLEPTNQITITIEGGVVLPQFHWKKTNVEEWEETLAETESLFCEWKADRFTLSLTLTEARFFLNPEPTLAFWNRIIVELSTFLGVPNDDSYFRIVTDSQTVLGATGAGMDEIRVDEKSLWETVVVRADLQHPPRFWVVVKEIASRMLDESKCLWRGRHDAVLNVLVAYIIHRLHGIPLEEMQFVTQEMVSAARLLVTSTKSAIEKRRDFERKVSLATLFELGFVQGFGWDNYGWFFRAERGRRSTVLNAIDAWVLDFSNHVQRDVSMYVELWGLPVSGTVKMELNRLQNWVAAGLEGGEQDETFTESQLTKQGTFQADQLMPI